MTRVGSSFRTNYITFWWGQACFNWNTMRGGIHYQFIGKREGPLEHIWDELRHIQTRLRRFAMICDELWRVETDWRWFWDNLWRLRTLCELVGERERLETSERNFDDELRHFVEVPSDILTILGRWRHAVMSLWEKIWRFGSICWNCSKFRNNGVDFEVIWWHCGE